MNNLKLKTKLILSHGIIVILCFVLAFVGLSGIVTLKGNLDTMEVQVEMNPDMFSDTVKGMEKTEKMIENALQSTLNIHANVRLMAPGSIPRSEGKAKRVIDNRKL